MTRVKSAAAALLLPLVAAPTWAADDKDKDAKDELAGWSHDFSAEKDDLTHTGKNPYFILEPGYRLEFEGGKKRVVKTVLGETKTVDGVECRVVEEREWKGKNLVEVTRNYFAISKRTNSVYYFGEDVDEYEDGKVAGHSGSWLAGKKDARFGLMMPGLPLLNAKYYQEVAPKVAGPGRGRGGRPDGQDAGRRVQELHQDRGNVAAGEGEQGNQALRPRRRPVDRRRPRTGEVRQGRTSQEVITPSPARPRDRRRVVPAVLLTAASGRNRGGSRCARPVLRCRGGGR